MRRSPIMLVLGVLGIGCMPNAPGTFEQNAFQHRTYEYRITYGSGKHLLSSAWRIDNFMGPDRAKPAPRYRTKIKLDVNGDGEPEVVDDNGWAFDVVLEHKRDAGRIWVSTVPVTEARYKTDLLVLMQEAVGNVSGSSFFAVEVMPGVHSLRSRRLTSVLRGPIERWTIAGQRAVVATFEVADVDRIQLKKEARESVVRLVFVRTPYRYLVHFGRSVPVIMVIGYANHPSHFQAHTDELTQLLGQIDMGRGTGVERHEGPVAAAPPPAPPPATSGGEAPPEASSTGEPSSEASAEEAPAEEETTQEGEAPVPSKGEPTGSPSPAPAAPQ